MEPTGFRGSGRANDAAKELLRLGIIMGSSSVDSSSDSPHLLLNERSLELWLLEIPFAVSESSANNVVSARALPCASMVKRTEARRWARRGASGIEASPERRRWLFRGETRPPERLIVLLASIPEPLALEACVGLVAGASVGRFPHPRAFGPRFSLKLLPKFGLVDFTGELAMARSAALAPLELLPFRPLPRPTGFGGTDWGISVGPTASIVSKLMAAD